MSAEFETPETPAPSHEDVPAALPSLNARLLALAACLALASGFVLVGGANLDLGPIDSKLGLAASEGIGPFGQVFGGWEPAIWPGQLLPSVLWAWGEGGITTSASVRWPAAIAAVMIGLILARRMIKTLGVRAGVLVAVCWFGSVALIDRSEGTGIELIAGLATIAALDRLLGRGSDLVAGLWAALAFLAGGWPPLALIALTTIVIGRREAMLTPSLWGPPLVAALAWSGWALDVAPAEAWAAALTLPLTKKSAWFLALEVVALGLPWSPFAMLSASRSVREGWTASGRSVVLGWLQVAGASLLVGTVIPGLASASRLPALAGLAVASAACCDRLWTRSVAKGALAVSLVLASAIVAAWALIAILGGGRLAAGVGYYRPMALLLFFVAVPLVALALRAIAKTDPRRAVLAVAIVSVCLKAAHWGYYVPEWNYRRSQGPWGRAIGQWVPPRWPIYTTHTWGADLAFATGRPCRQIVHPKVLAFQPGTQPKFVLLLEAEFEHWPEDALPLLKVASFQDEHGDTRVLARTGGEFSWRLAHQNRGE
jgi:hypothetical protein